MFTRQWFPDQFFAPAYWPKEGAEIQAGKGKGSAYRTKRLLHAVIEQRMRGTLEEMLVRGQRQKRQLLAEAMRQAEELFQKRIVETAVWSVALSEI